MAIIEEQLAHRNKGNMGQDDDWWHLCLDTETGRFFIRHSWDHVQLNGMKHREGEREIEIEGWQGRGSEDIPEAKSRLLNKSGVK